MPLPKIKPFLTGALFGVCVSFVAWRYHVVRYSDGLMLVPRTNQPPVRSAYVDIRDWSVAMWKQYPEVAAALVSDGQGKLIAENVVADLQLQFEEEADELADAPKSKAASLFKAATAEAREKLVPIRFKSADDEVEESLPPAQAPATTGQGTVPTAGRTASPSPPPSESLKSALDALFAPYGEQAGEKPAAATPDRNAAIEQDRVSATSAVAQPVSPAQVRPVSNQTVQQSETPAEWLMELESLEIELGEPVRFQTPGQLPPGRAENARRLEPGQLGSNAARPASLRSL